MVKRDDSNPPQHTGEGITDIAGQTRVNSSLMRRIANRLAALYVSGIKRRIR